MEPIIDSKLHDVKETYEKLDKDINLQRKDKELKDPIHP